MKKTIILTMLFTLSGCVSLQDRMLANVSQANGTPVSSEQALRYPSVESFIHGILDNKSRLNDPKRPLTDPVVWHAITHENATSVSRYAKKPKLDLEIYCKSYGGTFVETPSNEVLRSLPSESPLSIAFRAQAFAYSKGASESMAKDAFAYAYEERARASQISGFSRLDSSRDEANRVIREGYVGAFQCRNTSAVNSWLVSVDVIGYSVDGSSFYTLMRVQRYR